ncbi:apolipoprotein A-II [Hoplias malabaricus]|uniref:apolipoprotein A-II n=1 Tax=Hoplias malabaricus TaxID=27720 RepID=UPI0034633781
MGERQTYICRLSWCSRLQLWRFSGLPYSQRDPHCLKMKLVLALIVALQVSACLCEAPQPSKELVDKYEGLKATFYKRLVNAYKKAHETLGPLAEGTITGNKAKEIAEKVKEDVRAQHAAKVFAGVAEELEPIVEKARLAALGAYEEYLRPYIGEQLDHAINIIKPVLDTWLPAEEQ